MRTSLIPLTHAELVDKAFEWASNRCDIVTRERGNGSEIPDVMGMMLSNSMMIECKVSRTDFFRDAKKNSRRNGDMPGNYRLYCVPSGLIALDEVPEGWGLLEVYPSGHVRLAKKLNNLDRHDLGVWGTRLERHILYCILRDYTKPMNKKKVRTRWSFAVEGK